NVTYPLVPEQIAKFCAGKKSVLILEEGNPEFIEQAVGQILRKADLNTKIFGKDVLPSAGEYTPLVVARGLTKFFEAHGHETPALADWLAATDAHQKEVASALGGPLPPRPPTFC